MQRILAGRPKVQVGRELGVSVRTVDKWLARYQDHGPDGLKDRTSRPHSSSTATDAVLKTAVLALRRQHMTLLSIGVQLGLSRATVARIARAAGLSRLSKLEPVPIYQRYERAEPGELMHLDTKNLGRIVRSGHRITGDRAASRSGSAKGWEYLSLAYRSKAFAATCAQLGLRHHYTRPYTPRTNGKAVRFIQTALREWAYARAYHHSYQRRDALPTWLHGYNWHRSHTSQRVNRPLVVCD